MPIEIKIYADTAKDAQNEMIQLLAGAGAQQIAGAAQPAEAKPATRGRGKKADEPAGNAIDAGPTAAGTASGTAAGASQPASDAGNASTTAATSPETQSSAAGDASGATVDLSPEAIKTRCGTLAQKAGPQALGELLKSFGATDNAQGQPSFASITADKYPAMAMRLTELGV
jgi:hypothetical protein